MSTYTVDNVTHRLGEFELHVESCRLKDGKVYCIAGPNGSGKTTLLRLLAFLDRPQSGHIEFKGGTVGKATQEEHLEQCRRQVGFLMQHPYLFQMRVDHNVAYGLRVRGVPSAEIKQRVEEVLEILELTDLAHRRATRLSGGEAQRVALARVLVLRAPVLLLDEPTANLDHRQTPRVEQLILQCAREQGSVVVMTTHSTEQASRLADHRLTMINGRLREGPLENLFSGCMTTKGGRTRLQIGKDVEIVLPEGEEATSATRTVCLDPRRIALLDAGAVTPATANAFSGSVSAIQLEGSEIRLRLNAQLPIAVVLTRSDFDRLDVKIGQDVWIGIPDEAISVLR